MVSRQALARLVVVLLVVSMAAGCLQLFEEESDAGLSRPGEVAPAALDINHRMDWYRYQEDAYVRVTEIRITDSVRTSDGDLDPDALDEVYLLAHIDVKNNGSSPVVSPSVRDFAATVNGTTLQEDTRALETIPRLYEGRRVEPGETVEYVVPFTAARGVEKLVTDIYYFEHRSAAVWTLDAYRHPRERE